LTISTVGQSVATAKKNGGPQTKAAVSTENQRLLEGCLAGKQLQKFGQPGSP
jgi:hypothetical protein